MALRALIFDVDGTLANTERDGHRPAFNAAFAELGLPWHWDEAFYVLAGAVSFYCAGETHHCPAGTLVHVAAGTVHGFTYCAGGGQMLEMTGQGTRAAQMFAAVDREIAPGPPDIPRVLGVLARHGVTVPEA